MGSLVQAHPEAQERMCREMRPFLFSLKRCLGTGLMVQGRVSNLMCLLLNFLPMLFLSF